MYRLKPKDIPDETLLPVSDAFPTGYMGADLCHIQPGDIVAVWGCGPVGQFAILSAYLLGAERVIGIDTFRMGQMFGPKYIPKLVEHVLNGDVDPSVVLTHRLPLSETKQAFEMFKHKQDNCVKVMLQPD